MLAVADGRPELLEPLVPGLRYLAAEALYAVREEMAVSLADVLDRRTRSSLRDARATAAAAGRASSTRSTINAARAAMTVPTPVEAPRQGFGLAPKRGGKSKLQERLDKQAARDGSPVKKAFLASVTAVALTGGAYASLSLADGSGLPDINLPGLPAPPRDPESARLRQARALDVLAESTFYLGDGPGAEAPYRQEAAIIDALARDAPANASLLADLRSDKGMGWIPPHMWFTYLKLEVAARDLGYDLAVSTSPDAVPSLTAAGVTAARAHRIDVPAGGSAVWPLLAAVAAGVAAFGIGSLLNRRRHPGALAA